MKTTLAVLALLLFAGAASADSIWDYQGNTMLGCGGCALRGDVTLDSGYQPVTWSFTDGTHTLDASDAVLDTWSFSPTAIGPGPAGPRWKIRVLGTLDPAAYFFTQFYGSAFESDDAAYGAHESGSPGVWTESVPTAEPGTLALIGVGLAGLLARKRLQARWNQVPAETVWEPLS